MSELCFQAEFIALFVQVCALLRCAAFLSAALCA